MGKINLGRVILGGLLAGLILNVGEFILNEPILGRDWAAAMEALNQPPVGGSAIAWFVVMGFVLGMVLIWLYAAIRPRFGAGPKSAVIAGLAAWFFAYLYSAVGMGAMGLFPNRLLLIGIVWGLFELPIATLAGAWLYKEEAD
ncbi:hypothetical protein MYX75_08440 [Acidobacteria bacterium AH-259-A15]|nr:hypothetical protein [Acidobacteria bacterium AH-259-A15]